MFELRREWSGRALFVARSRYDIELLGFFKIEFHGLSHHIQRQLEGVAGQNALILHRHFLAAKIDADCEG